MINSNGKIPLEVFVMSNFVRYEQLSYLVSKAFAGSQATELNIYIDMYSVVKSLYSHNYITDITDYRSLTSCMINMCAHYREYFRHYLGVYTHIYIIMSENCSPVNRSFVSGYNETMYRKFMTNKMITDLVNDNCELLNILCPYLPDIHFVRSTYETSVVISNIVDRRLNNNPNLIISKDPYTFQLATIHGDTAILRSKKYNGEDLSYIVGPLNSEEKKAEFWNYYVDSMGAKRDNISIDPCNVTALMSLNRFPDRDLKSILNITTAKKYILNTVGSEPIKCNIRTIFEVNELNDSTTPLHSFECRYKALDVLFQRGIYDDTVESKLVKFKNLHDPDAVKSINNSYFTDNPIDLEKL